MFGYFLLFLLLAASSTRAKVVAGVDPRATVGLEPSPTEDSVHASWPWWVILEYVICSAVVIAMTACLLLVCYCKVCAPRRNCPESASLVHARDLNKPTLEGGPRFSIN